MRFGLSAIKTVGISAIESIISARGFKSLADLCSKVDTRLVNKKTLESLIKAGALDQFGTRAAQLLILDQVLEKAHKDNKKVSSGQVGLFGESEQVQEVVVKLPEVEELSLDQLLIFEKDLLGFYLHEPPFLKLLGRLGNFISHKLADLTDDHAGQKVVLGGVIITVKKVMTKKSAAEMAFVTISDGISSVEAVVFPTTYQIAKEFLEKDEVILAWGRLDKREDQLSLVIDKIVKFDPDNMEEMPDVPKKSVEIMVPKGCGVEVLQKVNKTLRSYPGGLKVALLLPNGGNDLKRMELPFGINFEPLLVDSIEEILGKGVVKLL